MACQGEPVEPRARVIPKPLPGLSKMESKPKMDSPIPARVLVLLDYDDTLIPTTVIQKRNYKINHQNTDPKDRVALSRYANALEQLMRKILAINNPPNVQSLVKIVTTASGSWVGGSMGLSCGSLWTNMIAPFNNLLVDNKVGVLSVRDFQKNNKEILGDIHVSECKQVLMHELMKQHFGLPQAGDCRENDDRKEDVSEGDEATESSKVTEVWKVISIGDSTIEYEASKTALDYYVKERSLEDMGHVRVSLHRVKFESQPDSFQKMESELRWCTTKLDEIMNTNCQSAVYEYNSEKVRNHTD